MAGEETLRARVQALVQALYHNNVNAAAKAIGIPQPTLFKLISGRSVNPRLRTLHRIAEHFGASVDWLALGAGDPPSLIREQVDRNATLAALAKSARLTANEQAVIRAVMASYGLEL